MTNAQIIMRESQKLAESGVFDYTGRVLEMLLPDDSVYEYHETEPIHTYSVWKSLGFQVKKGREGHS